MVLRQAAQLLGEAELPKELVAQMERLADEVRQPCKVAVVGRVKAGKSSFINALLGEDLAKVGTTETTATINYFLYGVSNPDRPVTCCWRNGQSTNEDRAFLDSLQGNDIETVRRADGIDHLEYHLLNPYLERVTLVDTPGLGAVVEEHQNRTAEFMNLYGQLRGRHDDETVQLRSEADAVIYVVGAAARASDRDILEEFGWSTGGQARPLNAIGVLAKVDLHPELLRRREELAAKIAGQLQHNLNTVVPVSAGIRRALDRLLEAAPGNPSGIELMMVMARSIPPPMLEKVLDDEDIYLDPDLECALDAEQREALLGDMEWMVFTTIAGVAADPALDEATVVERLNGIAGFDRLRDILDRLFFRRGHYLRGYRILNDARKILNRVKYEHLPEFRQRAQEEHVRVERLLGFIRQAQGDPATARELETLVRASAGTSADLSLLVNTLERAFREILTELEEYNADFEALLQIEDHADLFSPAELDELRPLLGLYGMETEKRLPPGRGTLDYVAEGQQRWHVRQHDRHPIRSAVAQRAWTRYGFILGELVGGAT